MRWPWQREPEPEPPRSADTGRAERALRRLTEQQPRVDELEQWAMRERRINSFSERMRRGMGGER